MRALSVEELGFVSGGNVHGGGGRFWRSLDATTAPREIEVVIVTASMNSAGGSDDGPSFRQCFAANTSDDFTSASTLGAAAVGAIELGAFGAAWGSAAGPVGTIVGAAAGGLSGAAFGALTATLTNMGYNAVDCAAGW